MNALTVLLIGDDRLVHDRVAAAAERAGELGVVVARDPREAVESLSTERPVLVIAAPSALEALAPVCSAVTDADTAPVVLAAAQGSMAARLALVEAGVAGFVSWPPEEAELLAAMRHAVRLHQAQVARRRDRQEITRLHEAVRDRSEGVVSLLVALLDMGVPGSVDRGARIATMARQIAERFDIPGELLPDLELAARVHEIGRLVAPPSATPDPDDALRYTQATAALLRAMDELLDAASLIEGIPENWDGTGHPFHWIQGQIPLRSRILRVLIDLMARVEAGASTTEALDRLEEHVGTLYDPMVVAMLRGVLQDVPDSDWRGSKRLLPITDLEPGMVLAEDLYSTSGLKLLSRDTTLTSASIQILHARHRMEPIQHGAAVLRKAS